MNDKKNYITEKYITLKKRTIRNIQKAIGCICMFNVGLILLAVIWGYDIRYVMTSITIFALLWWALEMYNE